MLGPLSSNVVKANHKRAKTFMKSPFVSLQFHEILVFRFIKKLIGVFIINLKYELCSHKEFDPIVTCEQHFKNSA